jgi:hypothetical protein
VLEQQLLQPPVQFWQHFQQHVPDHMQWLLYGLSLPALCEQPLLELLVLFKTVQPAVTNAHPALFQLLLLCFLHV